MIMEEKRLYDVDSIEFNELLDTARIEKQFGKNYSKENIYKEY